MICFIKVFLSSFSLYLWFLRKGKWAECCQFDDGRNYFIINKYSLSQESIIIFTRVALNSIIINFYNTVKSRVTLSKTHLISNEHSLFEVFSFYQVEFRSVFIISCNRLFMSVPPFVLQTFRPPQIPKLHKTGNLISSNPTLNFSLTFRRLVLFDNNLDLAGVIVQHWHQ